MLMMSSFVDSFVIRVPTYPPSLMTVTLSVMTLISSIRWDMYTIPSCFSRRSRMILKSSSISVSVSAADGSSKIITFASWEIAFAISHICCFPTVRFPIFSVGSMSMFNCANSFLASSFIFLSLMSFPLIISRPMKIFCATVRWFIMLSSWCTITIPASWASLGLENVTSFPS